MDEYKEKEVKVLDVDINQLVERLESLDAKQVYNDTRTIYTLDTKEREYLSQKDKLIRVTDEGNIKVTMHVNQSDPKIKEEIKFKTSGFKETIAFFHQLGLNPISKVEANRISYELGKIDFDIDQFPTIPPFLEIDIACLEEEGYTLDDLLEKLGLVNSQIVVMGTEDIHRFYGVNYFDAYRIENLYESDSEIAPYK